MNYKKIDDLLLVVGNVMDKGCNVEKSFAMEVSEIPYFIMEYHSTKNLAVFAPVNGLPVLEVRNGIISNCWDQEYLQELLEKLIQLQTEQVKKKSFSPICYI
ncbi:hypothetical protein [Sutcliffiella cohnii]|uniref:hypothetical protein n=1 Tax=Sutcliffiella cohnii TaxID=33932 RepID=UPI0008317494|nr:hypothetical protein [Sutcliffiella cohnii]